jgi:hypothetical protein
MAGRGSQEPDYQYCHNTGECRGHSNHFEELNGQLRPSKEPFEVGSWACCRELKDDAQASNLVPKL